VAIVLSPAGLERLSARHNGLIAPESGPNFGASLGIKSASSATFVTFQEAQRQHKTVKLITLHADKSFMHSILPEWFGFGDFRLTPVAGIL
jgi:hypothetical protein